MNMKLADLILTLALTAALIITIDYARADGYDEYCLGYFDGYQEGYCYGETSCIAPVTYCPPPRPGDLMDYSHGFSHGTLSGIAARN